MVPCLATVGPLLAAIPLNKDDAIVIAHMLMGGLLCNARGVMTPPSRHAQWRRVLQGHSGTTRGIQGVNV
jgi:hypothetical protein